MIATLVFALPLGVAALCGMSRAGRALAMAGSAAVIVLGLTSFFVPAASLRLEWAASLGASYSVAIDPLSAVFIVLCGTVAFLGAAASERVGDRRAYFAIWSAALGSLCGVMVARDLALLFVFWEGAIIAIALLARVWGDQDRRGAVGAFLAHVLPGSGLFLVALASIALARGTLDIDALAARPIAASGQLFPALLFLAAFAVALPLFPFPTWAPRLYASAPAPVTALVAAGRGSVAAYGVIRVCLGLFPQGMSTAAPVLIALSAVGALYTAFLATRQDDVRRLVAYVSLSQQGLVALALFAATATSLRGAVLASLAQALIVTALVLVVAALARRASSPLLSRSGGIASTAPRLAGLAMFALLAAGGVPGSATFAGSVLALAGVYERSPGAAVVAALALVASAAALAGVARRALHGPPLVTATDVGWRERLVIVPVLALVVAIGVAPRVVTDRLGDDVLPAAERSR